MKKNILTGLVICIIAIIFIGFGFTKNLEVNKDYQRAMNRGIKAVEQCKYAKAEIDFQDALKKKQEDSQASCDLKQVKKYQEAKKQLKNGNYAEAKKKFAEVANVDNGLSTLVRRASSYQTKLEEATSQLDSFNQLYQQAVKLNEKEQYVESNDKLLPILEYSKINETYYNSIRQKVQDLKKANDQYMASHPHKTPKPPMSEK